ncbi:hypothetical protein EV193_108280 [Herbihabitans rhizosphaerae]|uniref:ABC transporter family protein n=1 Tax=Herbihabitans rhizosphaerae TaxID=1872711 RepID=A0A4Q7KJ08_9PSEU|nr:hypothetical protein [Herbihabitans rhizosphaerae]RZS34930.1 hypothetical protein EV193_108280 [Herbihabitans rhizosphaerae]
MRIDAERVAVDCAHGPLLEPTSLRIAAGQLAVVAGEPAHARTAFGLALTGRIKPASGTVDRDAKTLRAASTLVDSPEVTAPEDGLRTADVIAEQLVLSGQRAGRAAVRDWLDGLDGRTRFESVPGGTRTRLLTDIAAARPAVRLLVIDSPDRHSPDAGAWWPLARTHALRNRAVVVLCGLATARALPVEAARLGAHQQPDPLDLLAPQEESS